MKHIITLTLLLLLTSADFSQQQSRSANDPNGSSAQTQPKNDLFQSQLIPRNSKVYIAPIIAQDPDDPLKGFETYLAAAMRKKNVPLIMVTDRSQADFEIAGTADKKGPGWAKKVLLGDFHDTTSASISVINIRTGVVAYADSSHRDSANRGLRSSAEKLAKYLRKKIEDDEKKLQKGK